MILICFSQVIYYEISNNVSGGCSPSTPSTHTPLEDRLNKGGENDLRNVPLEDMG